MTDRDHKLIDLLQAKRSLNNWIHMVASSLAKGAAGYFNPNHDINLPEMRILSNLALVDGLTARDLVKITTLDKALVSRTLKTLCDKGFIEQQHTEQRIRLRDWILTSDGRKKVEELRPDWQRREAIIQSNLSEEEKETLVMLLKKIYFSSEHLRITEKLAGKKK